MTVVTTFNSQLANIHVFPAGQIRNNTTMYVSGIADMRGVLIWLRALFPSVLSAEIRGTPHFIVSETWLLR
jgi:hypothetical protein